MKGFLFSALLVSIYILRFLTGNLYGILILLLGIYCFVPLFFEIDFLSFYELVLWIDSLDPEVKMVMLPSILTIIGFIIAFQIAAKSWKEQLQANLRLEASREIDSAYNRATRLITQIEIYTDLFLKAGSSIEENGITEDTFFEIHYLEASHELLK